MKAISLTVLAFVLFPAIAIAGDSEGAAGAAGSVPNNAGEQINPLARALPEITGSTLPDKASQAYDGHLAIGAILLGQFASYPIPDHDPLSYAVLNHKKVVIDRETRRIVKVIP